MTNFDEALLLSQRVDPQYQEPILHQVLRIAIYDEFRAFESYNKVIEKFGMVRPFVNIREAERRHINMLLPLFAKYNVPVPDNNWSDTIVVPDTLLECCELGVAAEIENVAMYDNLLLYTVNQDIRNIFSRLRSASDDNHLPAFRNCVARLAVTANNPAPNTVSMQAPALPPVQALGAATYKTSPCDDTKLSFQGGLLVGALSAVLISKVTKG